MNPTAPSLLKAVLCTFFCAVLLLTANTPVQAARYDLEQTDISYTSDGRSYTLTKYMPPQALIGSGPRGEYWIEDWAQSGWDAYFDYDEVSDTFTLYNHAGPYQRLMFLEYDELLVDELMNGQVIDSTIYKKGPDGIYSAYISHIGATWTLDRYITDALEIFDDEGGDAIAASPASYTSTVPGDGSLRDFVLKKSPMTSTPTFYGNRYMLIDDYDDDEWVAFSYDASTGIFAMYNAASGDEPYAYRKFSADYSRMENQGMSSGNSSGVFIRDASGIYSGDSVEIYKYITDGLLLFLKNR